MILDYSQQFVNTKEFSAKVNNRNEQSREKFKRRYAGNKALNLELLYNDPISKCPFCKLEMKCIHSSDGILTADDVRAAESGNYYYCLKCGYWSVIFDYYEEEDVGKYILHKGLITQHRGLLRKFEPHSNIIPLNVLQSEVEKNPTLLYKISPRKMEDLVAQVFRAHFNCEVTHCGKSHDGGIDLMIIDSDNPILVQVKRRANPTVVEPVNLIRDLLGAMFIKSSTRGIFVSTANKFSIDSVKVIENQLKIKRLDYFELIDFKRFSDILRLTSKRKERPWDDIYLNDANMDKDVAIHIHKYFDD